LEKGSSSLAPQKRHVKCLINQLKPKFSARRSIEKPLECWWVPEIPQSASSQQTQRQDQRHPEHEPPQLHTFYPVTGKPNHQDCHPAYMCAKAVVFVRKWIVWKPMISEKQNILTFLSWRGRCVINCQFCSLHLFLYSSIPYTSSVNI